jgi:hypothetical protein
MIKMIIKYFSKEQKEKRKKLRQIDKDIGNAETYEDIVKFNYIFISLCVPYVLINLPEFFSFFFLLF